MVYTDKLFRLIQQALRSSNNSVFFLNWRHSRFQICLKGPEMSPVTKWKVHCSTTSAKIKASFNHQLLLNKVSDTNKKT